MDVHATDGYPSRWPEAPARWLNPAGCDLGWVAERAGTVIGHVAAFRSLDDAVVAAASGTSPEQLAAASGTSPEQLAAVSRLFVAPRARGQGIAGLLMDAVCACARVEGWQLMLDVVEDGGPAVAFYERLGWRQVDRRLADWTTPAGHRLPLRIYVEPQRASP